VRIRCPGKLRRLAGRLRDRLGPRAAILLYHRVGDEPGDPYLLQVRKGNFAEQMDVLRRRGGVIPLRDLAAKHRAGKLPHGAVAITFDDGYVDNLRAAKPILERHGLPATVFMTAGTIGREREFWWDELQRLLLPLPGTPGRGADRAECPGVSEVESLPSLQEMLGSEFEVPQASPGGPLSPTLSPEHREEGVWNLTQPHDPSPRHKLLRDIHRVIRVMPHEPRQAVLDRLRAWAGVENVVREPFRAMSHDEIRELAQGGLIEVGAHTVTHPSLPALADEARRGETAGCRARLQEILGAPVTTFAYPYGDVDDASAAAVRDAGFDAACACASRVVVPRSEPLKLPRMDVLDWDGDTFARNLEKWLRA
jgi:peptidoglycan/xylan/chitin deacetylase (PgdA/CDA1 family)